MKKYFRISGNTFKKGEILSILSSTFKNGSYFRISGKTFKNEGILSYESNEPANKKEQPTKDCSLYVNLR